MSDTSPTNKAALLHNPPKPPPPPPQPGELLFEFHGEVTHTFWRCELRDHGVYGVEAQFLDPIDIRQPDSGQYHRQCGSRSRRTIHTRYIGRC